MLGKVREMKGLVYLSRLRAVNERGKGGKTCTGRAQASLCDILEI